MVARRRVSAPSSLASEFSAVRRLLEGTCDFNWWHDTDRGRASIICSREPNRARVLVLLPDPARPGLAGGPHVDIAGGPVSAEPRGTLCVEVVDGRAPVSPEHLARWTVHLGARFARSLKRLVGLVCRATAARPSAAVIVRAEGEADPLAWMCALSDADIAASLRTAAA